MNKNNLPEKFFPITKYDYDNVKKENCVSFTGSPIKHPYDEEKFILISDPLSDHTQFFEFHKKDVLFVEELSSLTTKEGESLQLTIIWIKIGVVALRYEPFVVGKTNAIIESLKK